MSTLFGGKKEQGETVMLLDIENGSVAGAFSRLTDTRAPQLYGEVRIFAPVFESRDSSKLSVAIERSTRDALVQLSATAARMRANPSVADFGKIDRVGMFLSAPWGVPNLSLGKPDFIAEMREILTEEVAGFSTAPVSFYTGADASAYMLRSLYNGKKILIVRLGGEMTELLHIGAEGPLGFATMPHGYNTLLRTLRSHASLSSAEAYSLLSLQDAQDTFEPLIAAADHFGEAFAASATNLFTDSNPEEIIILSHTPAGAWMARSLSEHGAVAELFPEGGVVRALSSDHFSRYFESHAIKPDLPLMLGALFMKGKLGYN